MPVRGIRQAKVNTRKMMNLIAVQRAYTAVTEVLIVAQGFATLMTPADTGNLRNSQYRIVEAYTGGVKGRIGYTARYAAAVHSASGKLRGQPRRTGTKTGNYWDPAGEPGFLKKAFEGSNRATLDAVVQRRMSL